MFLGGSEESVNIVDTVSVSYNWEEIDKLLGRDKTVFVHGLAHPV